MCGILGAFGRDQGGVLAKRLDGGLRALRHRGPDSVGRETVLLAGGTCFLGHARLSVIDLTSSGHQPMCSVDRRHTIVFNGEIYNYRELRKELVGLGYQFSSNSDTEVLLAAWIAWGAACLSRLIGMFAFAVLDKEAATLTCVRDPFGIKPFFYTRAEESFLFASEVPALLALKGCRPAVNWQRSYDYLVHGEHDSNPETFFDEVWQLPPGHQMVVRLGQDAVDAPARWWLPRIAERSGLRFDDAVQQVRETFLDSIRLHLRSDVALGAALSGGVDSAAVVCAMRHIEPEIPINTFSFIAEGSRVNEEKWVDIVNRQVGATAHKVRITPEELVRDLDELIHTQGEPFGSMSIYAQYRVYQMVREHGVTVTLDGQGADEILAGYIGFPGERIHSLLDDRKFAEALTFLDCWAKWPGRSRALACRAALAELSTGAIHELFRWFAGMNRVPDWIAAEVADEMGIARRVTRFRSSPASHGRRVVAQMVNLLTRHGLPALLRLGDRNSMRFSVESRVPFLSLDLVELLLSMPESFLISPDGETKHVFRKAMHGIVPDEILLRKDKIGFEPPEKDWVLAIASRAREWLSEDLQIPFIRREALISQFDEVIAGRRAFSWQVWRWINFCRWKACVVD